MEQEPNLLSENDTQKKSRKAEKALIALAVLLLLFSMGALYFDDWLWSGLRSRNDSIGMIVSRTGDVRLKFDQEVSWQKASQGQSLQYNDSVFAGKESEASLKLGESQLTVQQNSLVVLRREMDANFLNLSFGTLFGKVAKNEKVFIDTGSGKPTLLKTNSDAQIVLKKVGEVTSLEVVRGVAEVEVDGVKKSLGVNSKLELPKAVASAPSIPPPVQEELVAKSLSVVEPSPEGGLYFKEPQIFNFRWQYGEEAVAVSDQFTIEFSKDPGFSSSMKKYARGVNEISLNMAKNNEFFYRVKGPRGEVSAPKYFKFTRLVRPQIELPRSQEKWNVEYGKSAAVQFRVRGDMENSMLQLQISADPEFQTIFVEELKENWDFLKEIPVGRYYARAQSVYKDANNSDWSNVVFFEVEEKASPIQIPKVALHREAVIENRSYPTHLYSASDDEVKKYLSERGFLSQFFGNLKGYYDQLAVDFDGNIETIKDAAFPQEKLYPSMVKYRYQLQKSGQLPSKWSPRESVKITLEPPREEFTEIVHGKAGPKDEVVVRVGFTPVLFAKSYDFQFDSDPGFSNPTSLKSVGTQREIPLTGNKNHYWRVRALDGNERPLSGFSSVGSIGTQPAVQQLMAQKKMEKEAQLKKKREVASVDSMKSESRLGMSQMNYGHRFNRFWTWLGTGFSYVNYQQTIAERGNLNSTSRNEKPGQYLEIGYIGENGYGGVFGYKNTPGEVLVDNAPLLQPNYNWRTISLEGLALRRSSFTLWGLPIYYGPRVGVQSHSVPYVFLNAADQLDLKQNEMLTGSVGMMADLPRNRWRFHTYMRYQLPLSAKSTGASDFDLKPKFAFDGLIGSSYYFSPDFKIGAFWYGQWHYYGFVYGDGSITNSGTQSLFYSTMDIRLGFEF